MYVESGLAGEAEVTYVSASKTYPVMLSTDGEISVKPKRIVGIHTKDV